MIDIHITSAPAFLIAVEADRFAVADLNEACLTRFGTTIADRWAKTPHDLFPRAIADDVVARYRQCVESRTAVFYETEHLMPDGYTSWCTMLAPVLDAAGRVVQLIGLCSDVTFDRMTARAEKAFNEKLSLAMGSIEGGFWAYDVATRYFEISKPLAELIAGPGTETLSLAEYAGYIHAEDLCCYGMSVETEVATMVEYRVITHDGRTRWMQSKRRAVTDETGAIVRVVGLVLDVTEQANAMRVLEGEAHTDSLTQLKNRRAFDKIAARSLRESRSGGPPMGMVLLDLDGFKPINDLYGHSFGDEALRRVGKRLARLVRPEDTLARIGGDEFAVLLTNVAVDGVEQIVERIERAFAKPFIIRDRTLFVGVSCGGTLQKGGETSVAAMLERADHSLYAVKGGRRRLTA